jgi:transposase
MDEVAAHVAEHVIWIDGEIRKLEKEIEDHIDRHPGLKRDAALITSIPGIGPTTVARILGPGRYPPVQKCESTRGISWRDTEAPYFGHFG